MGVLRLLPPTGVRLAVGAITRVAGLDQLVTAAVVDGIVEVAATGSIAQVQEYVVQSVVGEVDALLTLRWSVGESERRQAG